MSGKTTGASTLTISSSGNTMASSAHGDTDISPQTCPQDRTVGIFAGDLTSKTSPVEANKLDEQFSGGPNSVMDSINNASKIVSGALRIEGPSNGVSLSKTSQRPRVSVGTAPIAPTAGCVDKFFVNKL